MKIITYPKDFYIDSGKYVIIFAVYNNKYIFVREKDEDKYSLPAGHIEINESYIDAAKRELYEETGALEYTIDEVCIYSVEENNEKNYGILYYANISKLGTLPDYEIEEIKLFNTMPEDNLLKYSEIQKHFYNELKRAKILY